MFNLKRSLILVFIFIMFSFSFTACTTSSTTANTYDKNILKVHYIDVGQADSILVQINNKNMLIDAGNRDDDKKIIAYLEKQGVKKLDYVVATHPHEDHIGGMSSIIKRFDIGKFYAPKKTATTKTFENMVEALNSKKMKITTVKAGVKIDLGADNLVCEFLAPNNNEYKEINDYSAVLKITYLNNKFLFMGDAEKISEKEILSNNFDISCDVLKVGHHGSSSSSSKEFLDKAKPKMVVISSAKGNDYGHPHKEILSEFNKRNYTIYRTDTLGTILITSDGSKITKK